ncbi:MAG: FtsX-like permease family protein [Planctomycetota bacterium]
MYKLFLTLRYLRKRRIAYFAIAAVTMCTAMVLIVMSVMGGFLDQLKVKARGLLGDIIIDNSLHSGFPLYEEFIADISAWQDEQGRPLIVKATPVIYSYGLLRFHDAPVDAMVRVVGLQLEEAYQVNAFKESLFYEKFYPGTTTLAEQQQPLIGCDPNQAVDVRLDDEPVRVALPVLPPPYQQALQQAYAAGLRDTDSAYIARTWDNDLLALAGRPPIIGRYDFAPAPEPGTRSSATLAPSGPPRMDGEKQPGLIIGRDIVARRLSDGRYERYPDMPRGCLVDLTLPPPEGRDAAPRPAFRYADDSRTGIYEIDSKHVYCDFAYLQQQLRMDRAERVDPRSGDTIGEVPPRCSQIQIKVAPGADPHALADRLEAHYRGLRDDPRFRDRLSYDEARLIDRVEGMTWEESQKDIIGPVEKERQLVTVLFGIISLVAAVLVLCILYMIVLQKTRDIGIVKSIGGSPVGVAQIFITYGAAIGIVGSAIGSVLGYYFVIYINEIQDFLTRINPRWQVWDRAVYSFDLIPNTVRPDDMIAVIVAAIAASTVGSLVAALRAGFMQPVEALRHDE